MKMRTASLLTLLALLLLSSCTIQLAKDIFDYDENPFLNPETIAEPHEDGTIRFLAFSDLHINRSATQSNVTERYEEIMNVIECDENEFDFILNLGDLNDSGDINETHFVEFIEALAASGIPSVNLLGNHELHKTKDKSIWENFFRKEELYGPVGCYRIGDSLSIYALDNSQRLFTVKQLQYLEEALTSDDSRYKILIMHENITSGQADDHSSVMMGTADTAERNRIYRLMANYGAGLMLCGHHHMGDIETPHKGFYELNLAAAHTCDSFLESEGYYYIGTLDTATGHLTIDCFKSSDSSFYKEYEFNI